MIRATISAPKPPVSGASWTTTARPVLRTDAKIVSLEKKVGEERALKAKETQSRLNELEEARDTLLQLRDSPAPSCLHRRRRGFNQHDILQRYLLSIPAYP